MQITQNKKGKNMKSKWTYLVPLILSACATHQTAITERSDGLNDRPEWASLNKGNYETKDEHVYVAFVEVDGKASKSAALNMSDEKALSEPMRALVSEFIDQNQLGEELRQDEQFARRIISATRGYRPPMPTLKITHRYWEKTMSIDQTSSVRA